MKHNMLLVSVPAEDKHVEGEAAYRLGLAYQSTGDNDTAKKVPERASVCGKVRLRGF